jgi:hypothetical protein
MHRDLSRRLLGEEVAAGNRGDLRRRLLSDLSIHADTVLVDVEDANGPHLLALTSMNYNAQPLSLAVVDRGDHTPLGEGRWPVRLRFGSPHPVTGGPWCCTRGLAEYYTHFSHLQERWDRDRAGRRLDVLVGHLLDRMGVAR